MKRHIAWLPVLLTAAFAPPLLAVPEPSADELKANRFQLEQWRKHPEQLGRLRRDVRQFLALPKERREQILKLDDDLQHDPSAARLVNVLERYAAWLGRLPEPDRRAIASTANLTARLALIQDLRDQEWMKTQARAVQEKWKTLQGKPRADFVHTLRQDERKRREEWQLAAHFWKELHGARPPAARLSELSDEDHEGVVEYLLPMLSAEEKDRLHKVDGQWPEFLMTLVEIADRHPLALPSANGPRLLAELPQQVRRRLEITKFKHPALGSQRVIDLLLPVQKEKWPALAAGVVRYNRQHAAKPLPRELWACNDESLLPPMREYVTRLKAVLTEQERGRLAKADNNWPAYPIAIQELAEAHGLPTPPWNTALSAPRERWDAYRLAHDNDMLTVPRQVLQQFALYQLEPAKLAEFKKLPPLGMWKQLNAEFIKQVGAHGPAKLPRVEVSEKAKGRRFAFPFGHDKR